MGQSWRTTGDTGFLKDYRFNQRFVFVGTMQLTFYAMAGYCTLPFFWTDLNCCWECFFSDVVALFVDRSDRLFFRIFVIYLLLI